MLDARTNTAAAHKRSGCVCADIGCDHGKLSAYLARHVCKRVLACDACETPLSHARKTLSHSGCENTECRLGDGLCVVAPNEVDDIVIAGLSGVTLTKIMAAAPVFWHPRYRFVFVPASKPEFLRRWLCDNGFVLLAETPVLAAGRVYTVLHVQYTGARTPPTPLFCIAGLVPNAVHAPEDETVAAARAYLKKAAGQLHKQGDDALAKEVEACLQ